MTNLQITHRTACRHRGLATAAWQMLQLQPRNEPAQECLDFQLEISPAASDLESRTDYFGNTRHFFSVCEPHTEMRVTSHSTVRRNADVRPWPAVTLPLAAARTQIASLIREKGRFELEQYLHATVRVPQLSAAADLAAGLESGDPPLLSWIEQLGRTFGQSFTFDPTATDVSTPLSDVLQTGRGVCQDFAHLFLSCVRQQGLPAAYVSGYLLTRPPPGQPRLRGADAMHAWVSVFVPEVGWVDYDPTNTCFTGPGHIVVARGRDYTDVSPTRGVFSGGGGHSLSVAVTVEAER
ncbi:MAG: transglutaminase family protein [Opitutaceae bacterium]|jgi:transglutaminase-like putative cysteine protease